MRWSVLFVVGCSAGATRPAVLSNHSPPPPLPLCSDARIARLTDVLRARWSVTEELQLRCVAGRFPEPGYFIEATGPYELRRTGVLAADGLTELVAFDLETTTVAMQVGDIVTADLDGDGTDEVIETWRKSAHGRGSDNWMIVRRISGGSFERIEGPHLSVHHPSLGACMAKSQLARQQLVVTVANVHGIPPSSCLSEGTHTFTLRNNAVVRTGPKP